MRVIARAIFSELERQSVADVDVDALAAAIEAAIEAEQPLDAVMGEGKHPEDLNATNDD